MQRIVTAFVQHGSHLRVILTDIVIAIRVLILVGMTAFTSNFCWNSIKIMM